MLSEKFYLLREGTCVSWRDWVYLSNRRIVVELCWDDVFPSLGLRGLELISVEQIHLGGVLRCYSGTIRSPECISLGVFMRKAGIFQSHG